MSSVVGVCGLGYTGSGAVLDLLLEYDDIVAFDNPEFSFAYTPDGLEDLEYHLVKAPSRYMASDIAIKRFKEYVKGRNNKGSGIRQATNNQFYELSMEYINSLIQLSWNGYWGFDFTTANWWKRNIEFRLINSRITPLLEKILKRNVDLPPVREMYLSVQPDRFYEESKKYIRSLIQAMGAGNAGTIVLNQPFAADYPTKSFCFFENPRAIVVDRDPRDVYLLIKKITLRAGRFIPVDDVKQFVQYYKVLHEHQEDVAGRDDVVRLRFEDLIYNYDESVKMIEQVVGLSKHVRPRSKFKPEVSINNTQLYLKYPEYGEDIKYIEKELSEWLFDFEKYDMKPNWTEKSF